MGPFGDFVRGLRAGREDRRADQDALAKLAESAQRLQEGPLRQRQLLAQVQTAEANAQFAGQNAQNDASTRASQARSARTNSVRSSQELADLQDTAADRRELSTLSVEETKLRIKNLKEEETLAKAKVENETTRAQAALRRAEADITNANSQAAARRAQAALNVAKQEELQINIQRLRAEEAVATPEERAQIALDIREAERDEAIIERDIALERLDVLETTGRFPGTGTPGGVASRGTGAFSSSIERAGR